MALPVRLHNYSFLEYRMLEEASSTKHEFLDGEIYAMAGGTPLHAALAAAVATALSNQLAGSECRVYSSDLRVRVVATGLATYPDATVVCGGSDRWAIKDRRRHVNVQPGRCGDTKPKDRRRHLATSSARLDPSEV